MTFEDLLKSCANGSHLPNVSCSRALSASGRHVGGIGKVTTIRDNPGYKGCAATFTSGNFEVWFWADEGTDKRKHYMSELSIIEPNAQECDATDS